MSGADGTFTIPNVPAGKQTIRVRHEVMGTQTREVEVEAGKTATMDFTFMPGQKAAVPVVVRELIVASDASRITSVIFR